MAITQKTLKTHIKERDLVSFRRAQVDGYSMQGFILACSRHLVLFQYVYNFNLDGFLVLRRDDITELRVRDTDRFQRELLRIEGVLDQVDFSFRAPIHSFSSFLASLPPDEIVILEDELGEKSFSMGPVAKVNDRIATIRYITGVARYIDPPEEVRINRITSCQIRTRYIEFYQNHFRRLAHAP